MILNMLLRIGELGLEIYDAKVNGKKVKVRKYIKKNEDISLDPNF